MSTLCYIQHQGKTLMMHRIKREVDPNKGKWNGLGGKIKPGETPEECVIREVQEESGLKIKTPLLHGLITFPGFDKEEDWYVFVFTATSFEGTLQESDEGYLSWIDNHQVTKLPIWEGDKIFLPWLEQERFFSAKLSYQHGRLVEHEVVFYPPKN